MESARNSRIKTHHELLHSREFQCFCCFHVRTGTIALGLIHVMMQMALIGVMITFLLNPELLNEPKATAVEATVDFGHGQIQIKRSPYDQFSPIVQYSKPDIHYALLMSTFFGFVSMFLMYGAFWGQASFIMPFFLIMCFDFAHAMFRLIGSFAERHPSPRPVNDPLIGFYLMLSVLMKAYLLNMVWSCYKYLRLRQILLKNPPTVINGQTSMPRPTVMEGSHLLPDYDSAQKYPHNFYPAPPPPYATATQMPTMEQAVAPPPSYQDVAGTSQQASTVNEVCLNVEPSEQRNTVVNVEEIAGPSQPANTIETGLPTKTVTN